MASLSSVAWLSGAVISLEGSAGIPLVVAGPVVTTGIPAVKGLVLSVRLAWTDSGGSTDERLGVRESTIGRVSSVALAAPVFTDIEIGKAADGCASPTVSEALAENVCLAGEGSAGGESVAEGPGIIRPPGRPDDEAGFSEARSVCALREVSFAGNRSVTEGKGTEDGKSVTNDTGDGGALSVDEPVWVARDSVSDGKSEAKGSSLVWGAFPGLSNVGVTFGVEESVFVTIEGSIDDGKFVTPGIKIEDPSEICAVFLEDKPTSPVNEGSTNWGKSVTEGTEI